MQPFASLLYIGKRAAIRVSLTIAIILAGLTLLNACASTPQARIYQGYGYLTATTKIVTTAVTTNQISISDAQNYSTIAKVALSSLDAAQVSLNAKDSNRTTTILNQVDKILRDLQSELSLKGIK